MDEDPQAPTELVRDPGLLPALVQVHQTAFEVMRYQLQYDDDLEDTRLDAFVQDVARPIIASIDCRQCGNCCRSLDVYLQETDVERLSAGTLLPLDAIMDSYVDIEVAYTEGEWGKFRQKPCAFLRGSLCSVYAHRPTTCREYPVFTPEFRWTLDDLIDGATICPIIYNVLIQMLKHVDDITRGDYYAD